MVLLSETQIWLHTELHKFVWNILTDFLSTEYSTELWLGKVDKLFSSYDIPNPYLFFTQ